MKRGMIGASAILTDASGLLVALAVLIAGGIAMRRKGFRAALAVLLPAAVVGVFGVQAGHRAYYLYRLSHLSAGRVVSIQLGAASLMSRSQVSAIVEALKGSQWFEWSHGGAARAMPMIVRGDDGSTLELFVAEYLGGPAAIIEFRPPGETGFYRGALFCGTLTSVLSEAGLHLPHETRS